MRKTTINALLGATAFAALCSPANVLAQAATPAAAPAAEESTSGDIIVTARRRDESIVDVPLAITVVSAEKLDRLSLKSTKDIANFTPGLEFSDFTQGNSRNDRGGNRTIIFRGLNLARNGGVVGAASMFLDGSAVLGNEIPGSLDVGAVEVLRGPQSVYFGRASMTGAIAYRTKAIPKELGIEANLEIAQRRSYKVEAGIAGPLVGDILGFRFTGLYEKTGGYVTNQYDPSGPALGERSRRSVSATLDFTPSSDFEIKAYGNYFEDEDGPSATVNIFPDAQYAPGGTVAVPNPNVQGAFVALGTVSNCMRGRDVVFNGITTFARATLCGRVPDVSRALAYSRTDIPADTASTLFDFIPFIKSENFKHMAGMQRHVFNTHAVLNWNISDYLKFQSITGYHVTTVIQAIDGAQQPIQANSQFSVLFFGLVNKYKDFSQEFRLSSDPEKAFSWTVGVNYINAQNLAEAMNLTTTNNQPTATTVQTSNGTAGAFNVTDDRAKTYGVFGGAYLKLFDDKLTISAEGRYQVDQRFNQSLLPGTLAVVTTSPILSKDFKAFYPRVSIDYDVGSGKKIYASFAKGGRPGGFNGGLLSYLDPNNARYQATSTTPACGCYAATVAQINSLFGTINTDYQEESLTIGELGFKGYLPNGKGFFDINAYYGVVSNQQVTQAQVITALTPATTLSLVTNTGKTEIYGIEFSGNYRFTPEISLDTTFAWNRTRRIAYFDNAPGNVAQYGISDYSGLQMHLVPIITGSAVLSYEQATSDEWSPFGNAALVYRGKQFADIANYSYIPGRATLDLRAGAKNGRLRLEAFVTNVFNNDMYPAGNVAGEFGINKVGGVRSSNSGFFGAYAEPRTFGLRASAKF